MNKGQNKGANQNPDSEHISLTTLLYFWINLLNNFIWMSQFPHEVGITVLSYRWKNLQLQEFNILTKPTKLLSSKVKISILISDSTFCAHSMVYHSLFGKVWSEYIVLERLEKNYSRDWLGLETRYCTGKQEPRSAVLRSPCLPAEPYAAVNCHPVLRHEPQGFQNSSTVSKLDLSRQTGAVASVFQPPCLAQAL